MLVVVSQRCSTLELEALREILPGFRILGERLGIKKGREKRERKSQASKRQSLSVLTLNFRLNLHMPKGQHSLDSRAELQIDFMACSSTGADAGELATLFPGQKPPFSLAFHH